MARAYAETGDSEKVWRVLNWLDSMPGGVSGAWFEYYGPRFSPPFPQVGIVPWAWNEMLLLLVQHIAGVQPEKKGVRIRPRLLKGMDRVSGTVSIRGAWLHLELVRDESAEAVTFETDARVLDSSETDLLIEYPPDKAHLKLMVP